MIIEGGKKKTEWWRKESWTTRLFYNAGIMLGINGKLKERAVKLFRIKMKR